MGNSIGLILNKKTKFADDKISASSNERVYIKEIIDQKNYELTFDEFLFLTL